MVESEALSECRVYILTSHLSVHLQHKINHWWHSLDHLPHELAENNNLKDETVRTFMRNRFTSHILNHYLFTHLPFCARARVIGCSTLSPQITKPFPNLQRRVQWSTQCLTLVSQPEQIGWSGSMRRINLAKRLQSASIPSSLTERATGY